MATFAPAAAKASAVAAPSPEAPPVTIAICPLISMDLAQAFLSKVMTRAGGGLA